jgi:signal transduction histidine kinase/ligand-binding sensor domain-containing protein
LKISQSFPLCALLFLSAPSWAVDPRNHISQYGHTVWKTVDGVVVGPEKVTQTTDGYIWLATNSGLLRFDGVKFSSWSLPAWQSLPSQGISALLGSRDGSLWIGLYSGLIHYKDGSLSNYETDSPPGVTEILEDHSGTIWITRDKLPAGEASLCQVVGTNLNCFGKREGNPAFYSNGLAEDSAGNLWFGCHKVCRMKAGSFSYFMEEQSAIQAGDGVIAIATGPSQSVWVSLDGVGPKAGVRQFVNGEFVSYVIPGFDGATVRSHALLVDRHKTLWVGTDSEGLYRIRDGVADHYGHVDGLSGDLVHSIYEDKEGNLWVTTDKGMDLFRDMPVVSFTSSEGLAGTTVNSVLAASDGSVWIGAHGAFNVIRAGTVSAIVAGHGLPGQDVSALFEDSSGRLWLGLDDTITTYKDGRFTDIQRLDGSRLGVVGIALSITADNEGYIWALAYLRNRGQISLLRFRGNRLEESIDALRLIRHANFLATNRNGGIWIGTHDGKLVHYSRGDSKLDLSTDAGSAPTRGLFVDSDNSVWAATKEGVYHWKDGHLSVMGSRNGLPCRSIFSVIKDNEGSLWLYARCGLLKILAADLATWIRDPISHVPLINFDHTDGVFPSYPDNNTQPGITRSSDGRLWFNGQFVQMIDPKRTYANPVVPPVLIEEIVADEKDYPLSTDIKLPALIRNIEIRYTALSFVLPQKVQFRYKLEGRDAGWQDAGTRRQAFYSDLRPGRYRFRVIACNNDGVWNETGAELNLSVAPAWYQTHSFYVLCSVAFLLSLWAIYRLRLRRVTRRFNMTLEARVNERTRIARELHDTLLQSFQGVLLRFRTAQTLLPTRLEEAQQMLESAIEQGRAAIREGRDAVQGLRSRAVETEEFSEAVRALAEELANNHGNASTVAFTLSIEGTPRALLPLARDEIYRIASEALRNAYQHAEASRIEVQLDYGATRFELRVRDNGKGVLPEFLKSKGYRGHFGLPGMRERAEEIGGKFSLRSALGSGTQLQVSLSGAIAYVHGESRHGRE